MTGGQFRLRRKGVFFAWRMSEGESYAQADLQTETAFIGIDPDGDPVGEFAEAFVAKHPLEAAK